MLHQALAGVVALLAGVTASGAPRPQDQPEPFRFTSGVELVNVTVTVSDSNGRFVADLTQDDFVVYEDDRKQAIEHFSAERVPVSLGLVVDTSGSMEGEKILAARTALNRFFDLLGRDDELFLYRFSDTPVRLQGWTSDRRQLSRAVGRLVPNGGTAMYDAVSEAVPLASEGRHRKKALVIISDGNDTSSVTRVTALRQMIRESELLVYAVGIDGDAPPARQQPLPRPRPSPVPFPRGRGGWGQPRGPIVIPGGGTFPTGSNAGDRVNVIALRELTDDSGGRTEIVRNARDLGPATAGIADELSRQYHLGYPTSGERDGQWRRIRVEVRNPNYKVRARQGYFAN